MRVLVTRPEPDASDFAKSCRAAGLDPIIAPLMRVIFSAAAVDLSGAGALAFTSANGVRAFSKGNAEKSLPVYAVGEATAATARDLGFENVKTAKGEVESLAALIAADKAIVAGEIVHIAGSRRAGDLLAALQSQNMAATRHVVYQMDEATKLPDAAFMAPDWVTLFSPRTAVLFTTLVQASPHPDYYAQTRLACLSEAVADAAKTIAWRSIHVAECRNSAAMVALMVEKA